MRSWARPRVRAYLAYCAVVLGAFGVLVALGVTTSSMGVLSASGTADTSNAIAGGPRIVRSDEYVRSTPLRLGIMHAHITGATWTQLDAGNARVGSTWRFSSNDSQALFLEDTMSAGIGGARGFAAAWWRPVVLGLLSVPAFLLLLGVRLTIGVPVTLVVALAADSAWWSYSPFEILGTVCAAGALLLFGTRRLATSGREDRRRALVGVISVVAGAYVLARVPLLYPPWSLPVVATCGVVVVASVALDLRLAPARRWASVGVLAVSGAAALAMFWLAAHADLQVLASTVYPGSRRVSGAAESIGSVWGGPLMWRLPALGDGAVGTNQSELATGWLVLLIPSAWTVVAERRRWRSGTYLGAAVPVVAAALLVLWASAPWPASLLHLNPLTLIPTERAPVAAALLAALAFAFSLELLASRAPTQVTAATITALSAAVFVVVVAAGGALQASALPALRPVDVWGTATVAALVLAVVLRFPGRLWAVLPLVLVAALSTYRVNPGVQGVGDLWNSPAAKTVQDLGARDDGRWAADRFYIDSLLVANSVPTLSGQQSIGPNGAAWAALDPDGRFREIWNRGASFVTFDWSTGETSMSLSAPDSVHVSIDPCDKGLDTLGVHYVVVSANIVSPCLAPVLSFTWMAAPRFVYERTSLHAS